MESDLLAARFQACAWGLKTPALDSGLAELHTDGQGTWWMVGGGSTRWDVGWLRSHLPVLSLVLAPLLECQDLVQGIKHASCVIGWKPAVVMNISSIKINQEARACISLYGVEHSLCVWCTAGSVSGMPSLPLRHEVRAVFSTQFLCGIWSCFTCLEASLGQESTVQVCPEDV